ncbi:MAG: uncharacterized protein JWM31_2834 [Solirubrobacterales bacterium]|nr:uncharacterized protein [Solirubrobacterales bacterium]
MILTRRPGRLPLGPLVVAASLLVAPAVVRAAGESTGTPTRVGAAVYGIASDAGGNAIAVGKATDGAMLVQPVTPSGQAGTPLASAKGVGRAAAFGPNGKLYVAGTDDGMVVRRFNANGSVDSSFGTGGTARGAAGTGLAVALGPCGAIYVGGTAVGADGLPFAVVTRFSDNGSLDATFGTGGTAVVGVGKNSRVRGLTVQGDAVVAVGDTAPSLQVFDAYIVRLRADGSPDPAFNGGGVFYYYHPNGGAYSTFTSVTTDGAGRTVAAGAEVTSAGSSALFARLDAGGRPDGGFGTAGLQTIPATRSAGTTTPVGAAGVAVAGGGEIVAGGAYVDSGLRSPALYALTPSGQPDGAVGSGGVVLGPQLDSGSQINSLAVAPDGAVITGGETVSFVGDPTGAVGRFASFGTPPAAAACSGLPAIAGIVTSVITPPGSAGAPSGAPSVAPPATTPGAPTTAPPSGKPKLSAAKLKSRSITAKRGTTLQFALSAAADVRITVGRSLKGRKKRGGTCAKPSASNRGGSRCSYVEAVGSRTIAGTAGSNSVPVTAKVGRTTLKSGTYRLTLKASGGNSVTVTFTVRKR